MKKISTGEDSTLKTYRKIAFALDGFKDGEAVKLIDSKIASSPNGENEEVISDERQMMFLLMTLSMGGREEDVTNNN